MTQVRAGPKTKTPPPGEGGGVHVINNSSRQETAPSFTTPTGVKLGCLSPHASGSETAMPSRRRGGSRTHNAPTARALSRALFVIEAARRAGVDIAIDGSAHNPVIFCSASRATTVTRRLACQASFRRAVRADLYAVALLACVPRGRA